MLARLGAMLALCCAVSACSSSTTNEGGGGAAGAGGTGAGGTAASACSDAGLACMECCKATQGSFALGAYVEALKACSCGGADAGCAAKCSSICPASGSVSAECTVCVHEGMLSPCIDGSCVGPGCTSFLACVRGCG